MILQSDKKKRGKAARNKGANAERELANLIRDMWGYPTHRGKVFYGESDVVGLDGIHVECKRQERLNIWDAMKQAQEEAKRREDGRPGVVHRKGGTEWLVTITLSDCIDLFGSWNDGR